MYYLGVDLGGTNISIGVVDENYNIVGRAVNPTGADRDYGDIIADMAKTAYEAIENAGLKKSDIAYVGIAAPGTVDPVEGKVVYANNLPFRDTPVLSEFKRLTGFKCGIANDANAAAFGELLAGAGKGGVKDFIALTLGTGVGGGIVIDGKIYTGFNYSGGELGHITINCDGIICNCGNRGCLEAYASATALIRQTREAMQGDKNSVMWEIAGSLEKVNGRTAFDGMRRGDETSSRVVDKYISYLAYGIISLINIFQPEFICVGGGICNEGETLMKPLREKVALGDYNKALKKTEIIRAELGNDAGIIGAAMLWK